MKRRQFLKSFAATSLVVAAATHRSEVAFADDKEHEVEFLLVQNAERMSLKSNKLTLRGIAPDILYFSDRPDRIVGRVTTREYVDHWAVGNNNFAGDPPNAVLSIQHHPEPQDIVVVLRDPRLEGADLIYKVEVLDGSKEAKGKATALFIDVVGRPLTPLSVAGVARRTTRRTVRRVDARN